MHFLNSQSRFDRAVHADERRVALGETLRHPYGEWLAAATANNLARLLLGPGNVAIDVGAGFGARSLRWAELVGEAGRVIAVEPIAPTCALLRETIAAHPLAGRIEVRGELPDERAGSLAPGSGEVLGPGERAMTAFHPALLASTAQPPAPTPASTFRLDSVDLGGRPLTLLGIDLYQWLLGALRGAAGLLTEHRPVLWLGVNTRCDGLAPGATRDQLLRLLDQHGYSVRDAGGTHLGITRWQATDHRHIVALPNEGAERGAELVGLAAAEAMWQTLSHVANRRETSS